MTHDSDHLLEVGQRFRDRRRALGLSVRQLAARANVSPSYVSAIETGRNPSTGRPTVPSGRVLESLHNALGLKSRESPHVDGAPATAVDPHDHTLVYFLGRPRTSAISLLSGLYERDVEHWVHIADPRTHSVDDDQRQAEAANVTRIVWPFGSEVYPDEFLVPDRMHSGLERELNGLQQELAGKRVGLVIEDCSVVMRWMVNPETEIENEAVWPEKVCHAFSESLGIPPAANVCIYKHADMEPVANRIDLLSTLLTLIKSHNALICVDGDGRMEVGEPAAVKILAQLRPSGVTLEAWNTLARASAHSLARNHQIGGTGDLKEASNGAI